MTREEYIDFANALKNNYTIDFDKLPEFCDMAISALSENKGDLISRTEVLKAIDEREDVNGNVNAEDIRTDICLIPSKSDKGEWISVLKRLPDEEHEVYCQLSDGSNAVLYVQDNWGQMEWVDGMMGTGTYDVVAWRELPEPYKAEKGGE